MASLQSKNTSTSDVKEVFLPSLTDLEQFVNNRSRDSKTVKKRIKQITKHFIREKALYPPDESESKSEFKNKLPFLHVYSSTSNKFHFECHSPETCLDFVFTRKDIMLLEEKQFDTKVLPSLIDKNKKIAEYEKLRILLSDTVSDFYQQWLPLLLTEESIIQILSTDVSINHCYYYLLLCLDDMMSKTLNLINNSKESLMSEEKKRKNN
jgi:hypothetical protein